MPLTTPGSNTILSASLRYEKHQKKKAIKYNPPPGDYIYVNRYNLPHWAITINIKLCVN